MRNYETKVYDYVDKKTGQHIVKARTMYAGKSVSAIAKCDPDDTFDLKFGTDLALLRLDQKIALKRAASMKSYTKFCQMNLDFVENEARRIKRARDRATISYGDRMVEVKQYEDRIKKMLNGN
jgi:hypothetical protein